MAGLPCNPSRATLPVFKRGFSCLFDADRFIESDALLRFTASPISIEDIQQKILGKKDDVYLGIVMTKTRGPVFCRWTVTSLDNLDESCEPKITLIHPSQGGGFAAVDDDEKLLGCAISDRHIPPSTYGKQRSHKYTSWINEKKCGWLN